MALGAFRVTEAAVRTARTCAQTLYPAGKLPAEEAAIKGDGKGPGGRDIGWQNVSGQAAAMQDGPTWAQAFRPDQQRAEPVGTAKYAYLSIPSAHICA